MCVLTDSGLLHRRWPVPARMCAPVGSEPPGIDLHQHDGALQVIDHNRFSEWCLEDIDFLPLIEVMLFVRERALPDARPMCFGM